MKKATLSVKEIEAIAVTRFLFGIGLGLLVCDRLTHREKRWTGWILIILGTLSTPAFIRDVYVNRTDFSRNHTYFR